MHNQIDASQPIKFHSKVGKKEKLVIGYRAPYLIHFQMRT